MGEVDPDERIDEGYRLEEAGDLAGAERCYRAATDALEGVGDPIARASALNDLAHVVARQGRQREAERLLAEVAETIEREEGSSSLDLANVRTSLAQLALERGAPLDAEAPARSAMEALEARACAALERADLSDLRDETSEAHALAQLLANALGALADVERCLGRYAEAVRLERRALDITERIAGPLAVPTTIRRLNIGLYLKFAGDLAGSEAALRAGIDALPADEGGAIGDAWHNLSGTLFAMGRLTESEAAARRAVAAREAHLGPDDLDTTCSRGNLAHAIEAQGRWDDALPLYRLDSAGLIARYGDDAPDLAFNRNVVAARLHAQGRLDEAIARYRRSIAIQEAAIEVDRTHPVWRWLAKTKTHLAEALSARGAREEAEREWREALEILGALRVPDPRIEARALAGLGCQPRTGRGPGPLAPWHDYAACLDQGAVAEAEPARAAS